MRCGEMSVNVIKMLANSIKGWILALENGVLSDYFFYFHLSFGAIGELAKKNSEIAAE